MSSDVPDIMKHESPQEYADDAKRYFRNVGGGPQQRGLSADDLAVADTALPSLEQRAKHADRLEKGFSKTSRSGAFTDKPGASAAIFPSGLKFASDFIDEMTPKGIKPQSEAKPPDQQVAPTGFFEAAEAVVEGFCLDCQQAPPNTSYVLGVTIAKDEDSLKCARHVRVGATVLYQICMSCWESAKELARDKTPLVLVFDGGIIPDSEVALARKYGFPINLHEGVEKTKSQWEMIKRAERLMDTLWSYIRAQHHDSRVFVRNRVKKG